MPVLLAFVDFSSINRFALDSDSVRIISRYSVRSDDDGD